MSAETRSPNEVSLGNGEEAIDIVIVGHVDHGKSTFVGRLLADGGFLPQGKLEDVRRRCARNAKPFEYAFLIDAFKSEQSQGITIDTARCFFRTASRRYILHDAPGHVEFIKNMVTGATRAVAALLLIDAHEGIQENSRRHGYILSMLGIRQIVVLLNKMDLVGYAESIFAAIAGEYRDFLANLGVIPLRFIPISAVKGENLVSRATSMPWYGGPTVLEQIEAFTAFSQDEERPLRLPVQDVYKFTEFGDERRIVAGTIESGTLRVGDKLIFYPSRKSATVQTIENFHSPVQKHAVAEQPIGITISPQLYIRPGEIATRADHKPPQIASRFRANVFWLGIAPMLPGKRYKIKLGTARVPGELAEIRNVIDASALSAAPGRKQIERHDVAEVIMEVAKPIAFDTVAELEKLSRFVIIDAYEIAGFGVILSAESGGEPVLRQAIRRREERWERGSVTPAERAVRYRHAGKFVVVAGDARSGAVDVAKALEALLFKREIHCYYLGVANLFSDLEQGASAGDIMSREEHIRRLGELARVITEAGLIFITALEGMDAAEIEELAMLNEPYELFLVTIGATAAERVRAHKSLPERLDVEDAAAEIAAALVERGIMMDYQI